MACIRATAMHVSAAGLLMQGVGKTAPGRRRFQGTGYRVITLRVHVGQSASAGVTNRVCG